MRGRWLWALVLALALSAFGAGTAQAQTGPKVLVLKGADNATNTAAVAAMKALGTANGFTVEEAAGVDDINSSKLADYQSLVFLNVGGDVLDPGGEAALQSYVERGNGFLGIGSTATLQPGSDFVTSLIGARPTSAGETAAKTLVAGDRVHPATRELPLQAERNDVWYQWRSRPTGKTHVVARYHAPTESAGDGTAVGGTDHPISWCHDFQGGRSFYMGMGRTTAAWDDTLSKHVLGALQWTTGLVRADCKATINSNYKATKLMSSGATVTGLATSGESHGLSIADNGWVLYIGRGDCRTDAERGALIGVPAFARAFNHADPNVGVGCGSVHIFDPAQYTGAENSGVTRAGTLAVYGDGGQGGERTDQDNHKMEYGLIGIVADPKFSENGYVYLQYFPTFNPATKPAGLPLERRISKLSQPRISRFTVNRQTKQLDLDSERIIFKYDAQIYSCCHVGGGMGFDSQGNLYVTTGDTNSSQNAGEEAVTGPLGYSGNNPLAKCPVGPAGEASSAHCGTANYSYQDARRTAGNTNDYNGKLLRFNPLEDIPAGTEPGVGRTYSLPDASSPNGPNLFDGQEGGGGKTKPEIYAMGLRNPSRLSIDPKTDTPYTAWVGPDAQQPNATWGPSTYENAAQITRAGNYGWPYCMGSKQAYRDRLADGSPRTANGPGYVPGGPASGGTDGWYDCDNLRNDSPNNTGLVELPHETGTGADAGKVRGNNLWWSRGNKGGNNGCPEFERPRSSGGTIAAPNYDATPKQGCAYVTANGLTVMNGPVYRYAAGADNSRRWPAYWDGRWFLHNNGNDSVKHALLLDPATAGTGGLPVWADSLRTMLTWNGSYMDSKFGPDGALYVQTYDGFFRAGTRVGLYRYDYVGGAPTPGANPRAFAIGDLAARFSSRGSGGKTFEWDFGDGSAKSTDANPTHTYPRAGRFTATLTVTYADGAKDSKTVQVDVIAETDATAPVTTATLTPATPDEAPNVYRRPVTLTLNAAEATPGSGVEKTEYRVNDGPWLGYSAPIRRQQAGDYKVEYRSTDRKGNAEEVKSVAFAIRPAANCTPNLDDEFNATALDPRWTVLREDAAARSFVEGALRLKVRAGDMIGDQASAKNVLLQNAPDGGWQVQTKIDVSTLNAEGQQAGIVLWQSEGADNTFAKITYIAKNGFSQYEWVATRDSEEEIKAGPEISTPKHVYLRVSTDGSGTYIAEGSTNGETWQQIGPELDDLGDPNSLKIGLKVSDNADSESYAAFDWFRVDCSDRFAPRTTATLTGGTQGQFGWWTSAPAVELKADDGARGQLDKVYYRVGEGPERVYEGPFTISEPGEHVVSYYATDANGNVENTKQLAYRIDGAAPAIEAEQVGNPATGPVKVTLDAQDGDAGSGTVLTEYRVDGGPWTTYSAVDEHVLLDESASTLAQWQQVGDGGFERMEPGEKDVDLGGISPTESESLGMLYYRTQDFGDFRLKLQFKEGRPEGDSNGGVFVRFPNPEQTPRVHECSKAGAAADEPAWVAINCGHEIQLYDGEEGESRKTGSVYTFDNNGIEDIGLPKRGQWEDYEIEVVGQHYKISRNGDVINEWDNLPGLNSDRAGDPSTTLRQFARGYIGLQNHGGEDRMQYRNVTIEDLTPGKPKAEDAKPNIQITGAGPHTIEVRATDEAGNTSRETFDLAIGDPAAPGGATPQPAPLPPTSTILPPMIDSPATYRLGSLSSRVTRTSFTKRGLKVPISCTGAMDGTVKLTVSSRDRKRLKLKSATLKSTDVRCWGPHRVTVTLKPSSAIAKRLAAKGGPKRVKLTLSVQMRDWGKPAATTRRTITLQR
ncbi:ThuA domain-containing protein [Solirubrobacter sp. CPCC 204708]|uniref:ThuA domain-containing protein n=1 Tax=Solirubrobacter deserti TaxID=2282478 RepID=A0ABT4RGR3_9ACTN|nr:ThuA domain-containing protein [Solirubrobacter deserti]MBE2315412.1 ThuA domain-containing protein [Solirubrobacter deserti]MDA0137746.1 ThuA domain-containing protein [Solirubrobacter deserti]